MKILEGKTGVERNKIILAAALLAVALIAVLRLFISSPATPPLPPPQQRAAGAPASSQSTTPSQTKTATKPSLAQMRSDPLQTLLPVHFELPQTNAPEVGRNIFAVYTPPPKPIASPKPEPTVVPPPPPPLILSSMEPGSVYAGTSDFTMSVVGDKFTPDSKLTVDDREMPTRFISAQKLTAVVSAEVISTEGPRRVVVKTPDGRLYSNVLDFSVTAPPKAPYTYIALIGGPRYNDVAVLKEQPSNALTNVTRGQVVGNQWRVTSISERAVELTHVTIRVKQVLRFESDQKSTGQPANTLSSGAQQQQQADRSQQMRPQPPPPPQQQQPPTSEEQEQEQEQEEEEGDNDPPQ